jgi:hypothetical protein
MPSAGKIRERFGNGQAVVGTEPLQPRVVRTQCWIVCTSVGANSQRGTPAVAYRTGHRLSPSAMPKLACTVRRRRARGPSSR